MSHDPAAIDDGTANPGRRKFLNTTALMGLTGAGVTFLFAL